MLEVNRMLWKLNSSFWARTYKNYETIYNKSLLDPGELKAEVRIEIAKKTAIFIWFFIINKMLIHIWYDKTHQH